MQYCGMHYLNGLLCTVYGIRYTLLNEIHYTIYCVYTVNASELLNYIYIYIIQASECQHFIIFCEGKKKHLMPADFLVSGKGYRYTDIPSLFRTFSKEMDSNSICMLHSKVGQTFQFLFANKFQAGKFRPGGTEVSSFKGTVQFFFHHSNLPGPLTSGYKNRFLGRLAHRGIRPQRDCLVGV